MDHIEIDLVSDGYRLAAGAVVPEDPKGVALLLHGIPSTNPPDADDRGYPGLAETFARRGWAAGWVDMRSVRTSEGFFSIEGWVADAGRALDALRKLAPAGPATVVGSSAGGAVAAEITRRGAPVDALALLAAPATWVSFAGDHGEAIRRITVEAGMRVTPEVMRDPAGWAEEFGKVSTEEAVSGIKVPLLVVHGTADDVVPLSHAARIAERAPGSRLVELPGAGHQLRRDAAAITLVLDWLDEVLG
jgi:pimeloyl-ACP methyl ester carboxylesterase